MIITPTNGRIVWYQKSDNQHHITQRGQPLAAMVCHVWGPRMVNLKVTDADGIDHAVTSVPLVQQGDPQPAEGFFAYWMPYQQGQAAKAEALERQVARSAEDELREQQEIADPDAKLKEQSVA